MLSVPRQLWGNVINFFANVRAWKQVLQHGDPRRVAWDKTSHEYPSISQSRATRSIGSILVAQGTLSQQELDFGLEQQQKGERLGQSLLRLGMLTPAQLGRAVAEQLELPYVETDPFALDVALIRSLPERLALKYMVLPVQLQDGELTLVRESQLSPVALSQIERQTGFKVRLCICAYGVVSLGVRHWYRHEQDLNPDLYLQQCLQQGLITDSDLPTLTQSYLASQLSFGDALVQAALLEPAVVNQVLISFDHQSGVRLGDYLLSEGIVTAENLAQVVQLQQQRRKTMQQLVQELAPECPELLQEALV